MESHGASHFGRDAGLIHEAVVAGRSIGAGREFWSELAHNREFFTQVINLFDGIYEARPVKLSLDWGPLTSPLPCLGTDWSQPASKASTMQELTSIDLSQIKLISAGEVLGLRERSIHDHYERIAILKEAKLKCLDVRVALALLANPTRIPDGWARYIEYMRLKRNSHRLYICFDGESFMKKLPDGSTTEGIIALYFKGNLGFDGEWIAAFRDLKEICHEFDLSATLATQ